MSPAAKRASSLSRQTFDLVPYRALSFLRAAGTDAIIRGALRGAGFTEKELERGWTLLRRASTSSVAAQAKAPSENPVVAARKQLRAWRAASFPRSRAALRRLHPPQGAFVFWNLSGDVDEVLAVRIFLDRCDQLDGARERKATRKDDRAALATLEKRGITRAERARLRELVKIAEKGVAPLAMENESSTALHTELAELHAWLLDWSETARAVIKRRDQLIRLGIGKRRARKAAVA